MSEQIEDADALSLQMWVEEGVDSWLLCYLFAGEPPQNLYRGGSVNFGTRMGLREALINVGIAPSVVDSPDGGRFVIGVEAWQLETLGFEPEMPKA